MHPSDGDNPLQATTNVRYDGPNSVNNATLIGFTVTSKQTWSGRLQNWFDADGSTTYRGTPTRMGSLYANDWWRLDDACTRKPEWNMWLCDDAPGRGVSSFYMTYDPPLQNTVGVTTCGNGDGSPCPPVGTAMHLGRSNVSAAMNITANPKITGPSGGFGWYLNLFAGAPRSISFTNPQINQTDALVLVLPYPAGTRFNITYRVPYTGCRTTATLLCSWAYRRVASYAEVRYGRGDEYFFDDRHVYFRLTSQSGSAIGKSGAFATQVVPPAIERNGVSITGKPWASSITLSADCTPSVANPLYCDVNASVPPLSPCAADEVLSGFDRCTKVLPTPSSTAAASASSAATASLTPSASPSSTLSSSASLAASPTRTATGSASLVSGTPSRTGTGSAPASAMASLSRGATPSGSLPVAGSPLSSPSSSRSPAASRTASPSTSASGSARVPGTAILRVEISARVAVNMSAAAPATRASLVAWDTAAQGVGDALCRALAAAVQRTAVFPASAMGGYVGTVTAKVQCSSAKPYGAGANVRSASNASRLLQATAASNCDPSDEVSMATGCQVAGWDVVLVATDTTAAAVASDTAAAFSAAVTAALAAAEALRTEALLAVSASDPAAAASASDLLASAAIGAAAPPAATLLTADTSATSASGSSASPVGPSTPAWLTQPVLIGLSTGGSLLVASVLVTALLLRRRSRGRAGRLGLSSDTKPLAGSARAGGYPAASFSHNRTAVNHSQPPSRKRGVGGEESRVQPSTSYVGTKAATPHSSVASVLSSYRKVGPHITGPASSTSDAKAASSRTSESGDAQPRSLAAPRELSSRAMRVSQAAMGASLWRISFDGSETRRSVMAAPQLAPSHDAVQPPSHALSVTRNRASLQVAVSLPAQPAPAPSKATPSHRLTALPPPVPAMPAPSSPSSAPPARDARMSGRPSHEAGAAANAAAGLPGAHLPAPRTSFAITRH